MMEHNVEQWDLANPMQAYQAALFLWRLKRSEKDLLDKFEKHKAKLAADLISGKWEKWTKNYHFPKPPPSKAADAAATGNAMPSVREEDDASIPKLAAGVASVNLAPEGQQGKEGEN